MAESRLMKTIRLIKINIKYLLHCLEPEPHYEDGVTCLIFSRDRAFQLESLLESINKNSSSVFPVIVQYCCSPKHECSYRELIQNNTEVEFIKENGFKKTLLETLSRIKTKNLFFLCDDQVFIAPFDVNKLLIYKTKHNILSMRLGTNITNWGIRDVDLHPIYKEEEEILRWNWLENKKYNNHDWGYQFSVDAQVYSTIDVLRASSSIPFKAPNSYEANMNSIVLYHLNNSGVSFKASVVTNLIINASRKEDDYCECESGEYTPDDLLELLNKGYKMDLEKVAEIKYNSAHYIIKDINRIIS